MMTSGIKKIMNDTAASECINMHAETASGPNGPDNGYASESENEEMIHYAKSCHETQTSSVTFFSSKTLEFLRQRYGLVLALLYPVLFSVQSLLVDILTERIDSFQVVFMYVPILMICSLILVIYSGIRPSKDYKHYLWLLGSGSCQAGNACFFALSVTYLAVGDAVTVIYTALIQVGFFSWLILKEPLKLFDMLFAMLAFGGEVFIARPPFIFGTDAETPASDATLLGVLYALAGSATIALFYVLNRKLSKLGVDSFFCIFFNSATVVLLSGLMCVILNKWHCPTAQEWLYALIAGVAYVCGHVMLFFALKVETATLVTVIGTIEIICAYVWQVILLRLLPFWTSYIGAILIFVACVAITVKNREPVAAHSKVEDSESNGAL